MTFIEELRDPKAKARIAELRAQGKSWNTIRETCNRELGLKASTTAYMNTYDDVAVQTAEVIAADDAVKATLKKAVLKTAEQLEEINDVMRQILKDNMEDPQHRISASREILNHLYFQEKLLNRINDSFNIGKVSKIEYNKISINNLDELAKRGYIKILRRPGEPFDPDTKEIIPLNAVQLSQLNAHRVVDVGAYKITAPRDTIEVKSNEHNNNSSEEGSGDDSERIRDSKERKNATILSSALITKKPKQE